MDAIDVVVVAYNSRERLRACVAPYCGEDGIHPIVVDNASLDDSTAAIADLPVTIVRERENRGFGAGCNAGWRAGDAPWVLFLNPDARLSPADLRSLAAAADADPRIGAVGPRIVTEYGQLDYSIRRFPRLRSTYAQAAFVHRFVPRSPWADEVVRDVGRYEHAGPADWLSGACLLVRRVVLERIGGFDERFFMYCEDADLCRRVWDAGYRVHHVPTATAVHAGGHSAPRASLLPVLAESRVLYALKHRSTVAALAERLGIALSSLTHAAVSRGGRSARGGHLRAARRVLL